MDEVALEMTRLHDARNFNVREEPRRSDVGSPADLRDRVKLARVDLSHLQRELDCSKGILAINEEANQRLKADRYGFKTANKGLRNHVRHLTSSHLRRNTVLLLCYAHDLDLRAQCLAATTRARDARHATWKIFDEVGNWAAANSTLDPPVTGSSLGSRSH